MISLLKKMAVLVAVLVLVVVLAVVAVALLFDPNEHRDEIAEALSDATGRQITLGGELKMTVFPWLALEANQVTMANAPAFGPVPMLSVERARASVGVMALLSGGLEIGDVTVEGLDLNLAVRGDGLTNWDDLLEQAITTDVAPDTAAEATDAASADGATDLSLSIRRIALVNATVTYADARAGTEYAFTDMNLTIAGSTEAGALNIDGGFDFRTAPDAMESAMRVRARIPTPLEEAIVVRALELDGQLQTADFPTAQAWFLRAPEIISDSTNNTLDITEAAFGFGPLEGSLSVAGSGPADPVALRGSLVVEPFALPELLAAIGADPVPTMDPTVLQRISFKADHALTFESATLSNLELVVDDTRMTGTAGITNFASGAVAFDLAGTEIDIDRYLPPATTAEADVPTDGGGALPVEMLDGLTAAGTLRFATLVTGGLPLTDLEVGVRVADSVARLHPMRAGVLGGSYSGDVRIDAAAATPRLSLDETVANVSLDELARTLFQQDNVEGTLNASFKLVGSGAALDDIWQTLGGDVAFELADGALAGTDLWYQIRSARALFKGETPPPAPTDPRTPFSTINGTFKVQDGVARNEDFRAEMPFLQLTGRGDINLASASIDYAMDARVLERPDFLTDATAAELDEYTEAVIPLKVDGPLTAPEIAPDIEAMLKNELRDKAREELNRLLGGDEEEDLEDKLKKSLLERLIDD